jgi:hypothetical protein
MLGFNGGLMGVRRTPTVNAASGLWFQNEQSVAQRTADWPISGGIPEFNPAFWYDFSDSNTVSTSSGVVTQVLAKQDYGFTLTGATGGSVPTYGTGINGLNCIDFGNPGHSNFLSSSDSTSKQIGEFYIVLDASFDSTFPAYNGLVTGADGSNQSLWLIGSASAAGFYGGEFDAVYLNGSTSNSYNSVLPTINSPCLLRVNRVNGSSLTSGLGFRIGQDRDNTSMGRGWCGLIGEIVVFSAPLGTTNRQTVQQILATKWGITLV